ncbi:hypothetical protein GCM10008090_05570 [Arenicella chitinivorans]|uniref:Uncharacterized protein n=1 Tax=Arenicella chitinivorans TaxID=1329800 RepID=A0A918RKD1_9GAMM|nr:hypothetical protein [Arenicella chitinivorans]GGZ99804.1 hypothetical protein GCM10008090_05570 [Arenicella chitinivorans]
MNWPLFFRAFLASAWRVKFRIAAIFIVVTVIAVLNTVFERPKYKTDWVVLLPGTERGSTINLDNLGEARSSGKNAYGSVSISPKNTYKEIALSDAVIQRAAKAYSVPANAFSKPRIRLIDQTPAMQFSLKGRSPEELTHRAELYNTVFHSVLDELRTNEIERHYQGVEGNLSEAKKRLRAAREAIVEYQNNGNILSDGQFQTWLTDAEQLRTEQSRAEVELASQSAKLEAELRQLGISPAQAQALLLPQANPTTRSALQALAETQAKESSMREVYGAQNPMRRQVSKELTGIRNALANNLTNIPDLNTLDRSQLYGLLSEDLSGTLQSINQQLATIEGTKARIQVLVKQRELYSERIKSHTREAANLSDLKRNHQIAEAIFSSALAKLDTSRLDIYATYPLTQLLTEPGGTIKRDRLQAKLIIVALFMVFGLLSLAVILADVRQCLMSDLNFTERNKEQ